MNRSNRDLLVLFKEELMSPQAIEHEVELLHEMLYRFECAENICTAHEIIDLNKYRIRNQPHVVRETLRLKEMKPFVFLNNKN